MGTASRFDRHQTLSHVIAEGMTLHFIMIDVSVLRPAYDEDDVDTCDTECRAPARHSAIHRLIAFIFSFHTGFSFISLSLISTAGL